MSARPAQDASDVYERHEHDVYAWAYRLLGRHHDALDVAQDVFIRWCTQPRDSRPEHPRGWLRRVTVNRAIDLIRSRRPVIEATPEMAADRYGSTADRVELNELRDVLGTAISQLTETQRSVLIAKIYDGLTFAQIADELSLAVPTVKTHYVRALSAVRARLVKQPVPKETKT